MTEANAPSEIAAKTGRAEAEAFLSLFNKKTIRLEGPHASEAIQKLRSDQKTLYHSLTTFFVQWCDRTGVGERYTPAVQRLGQTAQSITVEGAYTIREPQVGVWELQHEFGFPILSNDRLEAFQTVVPRPQKGVEIHRGYAVEVVSLGAASLARALDLVGKPVDIQQISWAGTILAFGAARLDFYAIAGSDPGFIRDEIIAYRAKLDELNRNAEEAQEAIALVNQRIDRVTQSNAENARYGDLFVEKVRSVETELENFRKATEERLGLDQARELWGSVARDNRLAFAASAATITVLLIFGAVSILMFGEGFVDYLSSMEVAVTVGEQSAAFGGTTTFLTRLVLISAPLGFFVWLIRLLVRFNTRSMLLMDDARQRVTMLETYFYLIEKDGAVKEDRGAILEALFRRAPGHGSENVEAPHFTDLLNYGRETGQRATG